MADWTWIRSNDDSDLDGGNIVDKALELASSGTGEVTVAALFNDSGAVAWYSPAGQPGNSAWRAGETATAKIRIITGNANVTITKASLQRVNAAGVFQETYASKVTLLGATAGVKTFTMTTLPQTGATATDRLRAGVTFTHNGSFGSLNLGIGYGGASDTVAVPIKNVVSRLAAAGASLGIRAATVASINALTAAPTSLAMTASPASIGMTAAAAALDPNKAGAS